jgi:uncharacterized membrane protein YvbJ
MTSIICEYCGHQFNSVDYVDCPNCGAKYEEPPKIDYQKEMKEFAQSVEEREFKYNQNTKIHKIIKIAVMCIAGLIIIRWAIAMLIMIFMSFIGSAV